MVKALDSPPVANCFVFSMFCALEDGRSFKFIAAREIVKLLVLTAAWSGFAAG